MPDDHAAAIERAFSQQADAFEDRRFNQWFAADIGWLLANLALGPDVLALDVAAGTGHLARAMAPSVRSVVALDATPAMLAAGQAAAEADGVRNVVFQRGDAEALPFLDRSFDVAVSRYAVHHFERPETPVAEMARCLRPRGRLLVADLVGSDDAEVAERQNELERLRDPSHTRMLPAAELVALVARAGEVAAVETRDLDRPLRPWLEQTEASAEVAERVEAALRAELAGGPATGFRPREDGGELRFVHTIAAVTAVRAG
jgi:ubiquinone/menaquinone biosynthesis C-methylase UbiE